MTDDDDLPQSEEPEDRDDQPAVRAARPETQRQQSERIERESAEADSFWKSILASPIGRRELWRLFCGSGGAHGFETRFPAGSVGFPDANAAWYARGEQDFGLRLYHHWLRLDPISVGKMHAENDVRFAAPPKPKRRRVTNG